MISSQTITHNATGADGPDMYSRFPVPLPPERASPIETISIYPSQNRTREVAIASPLWESCRQD
jgi:hypothetical protein